MLGKKTITKFICSKTEGFSSATLRKRPLSLYPKNIFQRNQYSLGYCYNISVDLEHVFPLWAVSSIYKNWKICFSILLVYVICCHLQIYLHLLKKPFTAWKVSEYGVFSGPYFPTFVLRYSMQSECGKIRTRKNSVFGHFSRGACMKSSYSVSWIRENC